MLAPTPRRPFVKSLSLVIDATIIALEAATSPARRDALRREKARLERHVSARRPRR